MTFLFVLLPWGRQCEKKYLSPPEKPSSLLLGLRICVCPNPCLPSRSVQGSVQGTQVRDGPASRHGNREKPRDRETTEATRRQVPKCSWGRVSAKSRGPKKASRGFPGGPVARLHAPNVGGPGLIPGRGTRSHMSQLRLSAAKFKKKKAVPLDKINKTKKAIRRDFQWSSGCKSTLRCGGMWVRSLFRELGFPMW